MKPNKVPDTKLVSCQTSCSLTLICQAHGAGEAAVRSLMAHVGTTSKQNGRDKAMLRPQVDHCMKRETVLIMADTWTKHDGCIFKLARICPCVLHATFRYSSAHTLLSIIQPKTCGSEFWAACVQMNTHKQTGLLTMQSSLFWSDQRLIGPTHLHQLWLWLWLCLCLRQDMAPNSTGRLKKPVS